MIHIQGKGWGDIDLSDSFLDDSLGGPLLSSDSVDSEAKIEISLWNLSFS